MRDKWQREKDTCTLNSIRANIYFVSCAQCSIRPSHHHINHRMYGLWLKLSSTSPSILHKYYLVFVVLQAIHFIYFSKWSNVQTSNVECKTLNYSKLSFITCVRSSTKSDKKQNHVKIKLFKFQLSVPVKFHLSTSFTPSIWWANTSYTRRTIPSSMSTLPFW